ncbi:MAG: hypothetical protein UH824_01510, partial [Acutalibacteraceae bacterium]|nr:hypothetical protein [Acutalibacteraceae bacterium]
PPPHAAKENTITSAKTINNNFFIVYLLQDIKLIVLLYYKLTGVCPLCATTAIMIIKAAFQI